MSSPRGNPYVLCARLEVLSRSKECSSSCGGVITGADVKVKNSGEGQYIPRYLSISHGETCLM